MRIRTRDFRSSNVLGVLPGHDPALADRHVIVSAQYDHLGVGEPVRGDSIYNGVIENSSGVAASLEIARLLAGAGAQRRSLLFVFLTAEETGLLGARHYVANPVVPLHRSVRPADAFEQSDQLAFAQAGIPSMLVQEGTDSARPGR